MTGWSNGVYGAALPQLYLEVAHRDLSVKLGHFFTLLGYQVVPATGNFFYSQPFTFNFGEAFTHTGALATYAASERVEVYAGYTLGWDTGFAQLNGGSNFLGGAKAQLSDQLSLTYITTWGNLGWIGSGYSHSLVADWQINENWEYVLQTDLDSTTYTGYGGTGYNAIGINQYLYHTLNAQFKAGGRFEWWRANSVSHFAFTAGLNWLPIPNVRLRPELRYQWIAGSSNPIGIPNNTWILGIDGIVSI
ncbi:MAG: outer membrane beta-barrel protein [Bdellovibrionota bacterium]